jgi:hypothetical protein
LPRGAQEEEEKDQEEEEEDSGCKKARKYALPLPNESRIKTFFIF